MKQKILKILNPILFFVLFMLLLGVLLFNFLIPQDMEINYFIRSAHPWWGLGFAVLSAAHIVLNWDWVKFNIFGINPKAAQK